MKDCKKIHPLLSPYLDNLLSSRERGRVEAHLKACAEARKELDQLKRLREVMVHMPEPRPPIGLHDRIMARLKGHPLPVTLHHPFWVLPAGVLTAAAMVVLYLTIQNPSLLNFQKQTPVAAAAKEEKPPVGGLAGPLTPAASKDLSVEKNKKSSDMKNYDGYGYEGPSTGFAPVPAQGLQNSEPRPVLKRAEKKVSNEDLSLDKSAANGVGAQAPAADQLAGKPLTEVQFSGNTTLSQPENRENAQGAPAAVPAVSSQSELPPAPTETPVSSWAGSVNPSSSELQQLVTDENTFQMYWHSFEPDKPLPTVDFSTQAVVVLMDQERPTAGYSIQISGLEEQPSQLVIHYKVDAPPAGNVNAQVLTRPWTIQLISKPSKPVVFEKD